MIPLAKGITIMNKIDDDKYSEITVQINPEVYQATECRKLESPGKTLYLYNGQMEYSQSSNHDENKPPAMVEETKVDESSAHKSRKSSPMSKLSLNSKPMEGSALKP